MQFLSFCFRTLIYLASITFRCLAFTFVFGRERCYCCYEVRRGQLLLLLRSLGERTMMAGRRAERGSRRGRQEDGEGSYEMATLCYKTCKTY